MDVGDSPLDRLVASSPWGRSSHRQFHCTLQCHMSHQNVTARAQQLKEQDESEGEVVVLANWLLPHRVGI